MDHNQLPYEWRYLPRGTVVHAIHRLGGGIAATALCGTGPWCASEWLGTGRQDEYERAATLPACRNCLRAAGRNPADYTTGQR